MASTFMAMSNGMGISADAGKSMSKSLTGLAGDMASFYNVSTDVANTALQSVFTGETESLKKFGIVLTEANLQAYALSQGITKSVSAMSQAEKVALRYNYVLSATSKVQGDFARTSGSWANQVRILKEQWNQLMGVLGKVLINVLTPIVKALNEMLASLISIANAFAKVFGGKGIQKSTSTVSSGIGDIADSAGDASGSIEDTNEQAKELAKTIAGFDELNILNSNKEDENSGSEGGAGGGSGTVEGSGEIIEGPEYEDPSSKVAEYFEKLKAIFSKWADTIPKLEFNFDEEQAIEDLQNIGLNIANIIAGWGSFVISIAIKVANDLDIGKLTNDFLSLVEAATGLASAMTDVLVPALEAFYESSGINKIVQWIGETLSDAMQFAKEKMDDWAQWFADNADTINEFFNNLGLALSPLSDFVILIGDAAWSAFKLMLEGIDLALRGIADSIINLNLEQLENLRDIIVAIGAAVLGSNLAHVLNNMFNDIDVSSIMDVFSYLEGYFTGDGALTMKIVGFGEKIKSVFASIGAATSPILSAMQAEYSAVVNQLGASQGVFTTIKGVVSACGAGFKALWATLSANPITLIIAAIALVVASLITLYNNSESFRQFLSDLWEDIKEIFSGITSRVSELWENSLKPFWEQYLKPLFTTIGQGLSELWNTISSVVGWIVGIVGGELLTGITSALGSIIDFIADCIENGLTIISGIIDFLTGVFTGDWEKAWDGIKKIFEGIWNSLVDGAKGPINLIIGLINGLIKGIVSGVNVAIRAINKIHITIPSWIPGIGGNSIGFNITELTAPQIPLLANGGVIDAPTVAMMGEYAGAGQNPEIVAPQALLQQTIENSNNNVVSALIQQTKQLIVALEGINMEVSIGDETIAQSAKRGNQAYKNRTGKPLFA